MYTVASYKKDLLSLNFSNAIVESPGLLHPTKRNCLVSHFTVFIGLSVGIRRLTLVVHDDK